MRAFLEAQYLTLELRLNHLWIHHAFVYVVKKGNRVIIKERWLGTLQDLVEEAAVRSLAFGENVAVSKDPSSGQ